MRRRRAPARNRPPLGFGSSCRAEGEAAESGARGAVDTDAMDEGGEAEADAMAPRWVAEEEQELVLACVRLLLPAEARALRLESCLASSVLVWIRTRPGVIRLAGSRRTSVLDRQVGLGRGQLFLGPCARGGGVASESFSGWHFTALLFVVRCLRRRKCGATSLGLRLGEPGAVAPCGGAPGAWDDWVTGLIG